MIINRVPIVTVAVISYNSENTIVETLESVLLQSYGANNIELIVSDDYSRDRTIDIVEEWLVKRAHLFHEVKILKAKENGGIPKNCNRAWRVSEGEWIKSIAADDILVENAIESLVSFPELKNVDCIFGLLEMFPDGYGITYPRGNDFRLKFFELNALQQHESLLIGNVLYAPASFIRRSALERVGFADECFSLLEDYPLWLKLTKLGIKLELLNELVVRYRVGESTSVSVSRKNNILLNKEIRKCVRNSASNCQSKFKRALLYFDCSLGELYDWCSQNFFDSRHSRILSVIKLISPIVVYRKIR
ncbi:glycosyltransferase [Shewanella algae]|uniref:glycosyltransferase n=1 Tax=Shewanella algae TaxID=38313 RepID=UPI003AB07291